MFKKSLLLIALLVAPAASAALITMEIDALCSVSDYDPSATGDELKIEYLITNTTESSGFSDALYRILIPAGIDQSIYSVHVPEHWVALVHSDHIELYTLPPKKRPELIVPLIPPDPEQRHISHSFEFKKDNIRLNIRFSKKEAIIEVDELRKITPDHSNKQLKFDFG